MDPKQRQADSERIQRENDEWHRQQQFHDWQLRGNGQSFPDWKHDHPIMGGVYYFHGI